MASGDFSPHRTIAIQFTSVVRDGKATAIETIAKNETPHPKRAVAPDAEATDGDTGKVATAKREVKGQASAAAASLKHQVTDVISEVKDPGRTDRAKQWAVSKLPYHPQTLYKGTVYDAELLTSVDFGKTTPHPLAPEGTMPAPDSILSARLLSTLDSGSTPRGSPLEAIVTEPVFAEDGRLIFPEGTKLTGEVTFVRRARRFHRNGQLRFLFERVEPPNQNSAPLLPPSMRSTSAPTTMWRWMTRVGRRCGIQKPDSSNPHSRCWRCAVRWSRVKDAGSTAARPRRDRRRFPAAVGTTLRVVSAA